MKEILSKSKLEELLPTSFNWLEDLQFSKCDATVSGAHHLIVTESNEKASAGFDINCASLSESAKTEIFAQAKILGWKGSGSVTLSAGDAVYSLMAKPSVASSASQIGRQIGLDYSKAVKGKEIAEVILCGTDKISPLDIFEGMAQGFYDCHVFKGKGVEVAAPNFPKTVKVLSSKTSDDEMKSAVAMAKSVTFTRFLQDAPPNVMDSEFLGDISKEMSDKVGIKCNLKGRKEIKELGMGAFISVADGTPIDPKLITIEIEGKDKSKTVALVGKGLTFDAGGISIKPSVGMHEMKYDMSGGAAVLGAAMFLGMVQPPVNVVCVVGAVENMPGVTATRPGDIVKAMNGKTIEVLNTDAEGRLVLADILHYTETTFKPDLMIDIATLTGAVLHGLGTVGSALMSNDQSTADYLLGVSRETGEPFWQLPLWPENEKDIKSDIADYKNIAAGSVKGGSIVAGTFLKEFVGSTKWAHLDIAGTGWSCRATGYPTVGGSAFGLRLMSQACMNFNR